MEVIYTNSNGESVTLRQRKPVFLNRIDGTGNLTNSVNTFKAPLQDGEFFVNSSLEMRNITLEGQILTGKPKDVDTVYGLRAELLRIFNPKAAGTLSFREKKIDCRVEDVTVSFETARERFPSFFISLLCPYPFFTDDNDGIINNFTAWESGFEFELEIPEEGIEFATRTFNQLVTLTNFGDIPCGLEIIFKTYSDVVNPELMNVDTGEVIRLLTTLTAGEEYRVYTDFAGKRVEYIQNGIKVNAFNVIDPQSTFFSIPVGGTLFKYDAVSGVEELDITVKYNLRYLGV
jgi:hypothetical protein